MYQDRYVKVRRPNGETEYIEINQLKFERHAYPIERIEIVEEFHFETEICGQEIFASYLNIGDIIHIYSLLCKSYCKLSQEIQQYTLLDAPHNVIEREYILRTILTNIKETFPEVYWDRNITWRRELSSSATDLLKQLSHNIPCIHTTIKYTQPIIIPYPRRFN
jgi:hypothetical protein